MFAFTGKLSSHSVRRAAAASAAALAAAAAPASTERENRHAFDKRLNTAMPCAVICRYDIFSSLHSDSKHDVALGISRTVVEVPTPEPVQEKHELTWQPAVIWCAAITSITMSLFCIFWTKKYSDRLILKLSVPPYLFMVCAGTLMSTFSALIPIMLQKSGCQLMIYLYGMGFTTVCSALCTKMFSMERVLDNSLKMKSSQYDIKTAAKMMLGMGFFELAILVAWSLSSDPLHFERQCMVYVDSGMWEGECLESVGKCRSQHAGVFVTVLTLYHVLCMGAGMAMCYHVRNLPSLLAEGKWVFTAFYSQLQAVIIAVPVLIMIKDEYEYFTFLKSLVICATDLTTLMMLFFPKIQLIKKYHDFDKKLVSEYIQKTMSNSTQDDSVYEMLRKKRGKNASGDDTFVSAVSTTSLSPSSASRIAPSDTDEVNEA